MAQPMAVRGIYQARGERGALAQLGLMLLRFRVRKKPPQCRLRRTKSSPAQAQGNKRQQQHRAQEPTPRRALQGAKSPEPFPHQQGELGASRFP
jgi:hypothetical protein